MEAELADGTILEFPDGTDPLVIQATVKKMVAGGQQPTPVTAPALTTMQQFQADARADHFKRKTAPVIGPVGQIEGGMNMVSGMGASALGGLAGIAGAIIPGPQGQGADWSKSIQDMGTYRPRSDAGKLASESLAAPMTVANDVSKYLGGKIGSLMGVENAGELVGEVAPTIVGSLFGIRTPLKSIATTPYKGTGLSMPSIKGVVEQSAPSRAVKDAVVADVARIASDKDWQASARIDTVKEAQSLPHPPSLNPSMSNPTVMTRAETGLTGGSAVDVAMSKANKNVWANNAKSDMGLHVDTPLTSDAPFKAVRTRAAKPYGEVAKIGRMVADDTVLSDLSNIRVPDLISDPTAAPKVQSLVDRATNKINNGMTGADALEQIKQLRADADAINGSKAKGTKVDPSDTAKAKASLEIANTLEKLIENNIPLSNPTLLADFKKARTEIAKSYAYQKATNLDTGYLDPSKLPDNMTGVGATMRKVAANFPDAANVAPSLLGRVKTSITRAGPAGSIGFAAGSLVGAPFAGAVIGAGIGEVGGMINARRMTKRAYQESNAVPKDRRIMPLPEPNPPAPQPTLNIGLSQDYIPPTPFRESGSAAPNFVMKPNRQLNEVPQIGLSKGPVEGQPKGLSPLTPSDTGAVIRVPSDYARSKLAASQEALRLATEKEVALAKMSERNMSKETRVNLMTELERQRAIVAKEEAFANRYVEQYGLIEDAIVKPRSSSRGYTQGDKTRKFQRGLLTDLGDPK